MFESPLGELFPLAFFVFGLSAGLWWFLKLDQVWKKRFGRYLCYTFPMFLALASFQREIINWGALFRHEYQSLVWKLLGVVVIPFLGFLLYLGGIGVVWLARTFLRFAGVIPHSPEK